MGRGEGGESRWGREGKWGRVDTVERDGDILFWEGERVKIDGED